MEERSVFDVLEEFKSLEQRGIISAQEKREWSEKTIKEGPTDEILARIESLKNEVRGPRFEKNPHSTETRPENQHPFWHDKKNQKALIASLITLVLLIGFGRIYYGGGFGIQFTFKSAFSFKDTIVNLDEIIGMPRFVVAMNHPSVKKQLEEKGWIKTDEETVKEIMGNAQKAIFPTNDGIIKDFPLSNFSYRNEGTHTVILGEIRNPNNRDFNTVFFKLNIYDSNNKLLCVERIIINSFRSRSTSSFSEMVFQDLPSRIKYTLEFESAF